MSSFDSLTWALEVWFDKPACDLPDPLRQRVTQEFPPVPWDLLSTDQRRSVALQLDYQNDPAMEKDRQEWWGFFQRMDALKAQIDQWDVVAALGAGELALKEEKLAALRSQLDSMERRARQTRGAYYPEQKLPIAKEETPLTKPAIALRYIPYPKAMHQLTTRLGATPEELAAWLYMGPKDGGIAAYLNANELDSPPRFCFELGGDFDYVSPLMACWFVEEEIVNFEPTDRYMTGTALIERWSKKPDLQALAFIVAKVKESRLVDMHPMYGLTTGTVSPEDDFPPLTSALFVLSHIEQIEAADFPQFHDLVTSSVTEEGAVVEVTTAGPAASQSEPRVADSHQQIASLGSAQWRKQNAQAAANVRHDKPGGSRDKKRQLREIWASGKYTTRDGCAEQECAAIGMSFTVARKALANTPEPDRR